MLQALGTQSKGAEAGEGGREGRLERGDQARACRPGGLDFDVMVVGAIAGV